MTVESISSKEIYAGNGAATVFPVPFEYSKTEDIRLLLTDAAGAETEITDNFLVSVNESGDTNVTYPLSGLPMPAGNKLTVYRDTPLSQIVDLIYGGAFSPDVLEHDGLDRLEMQIQEIDEETRRAIKVPISSDKTPEELLDELLAASKEADRAKAEADRAEAEADRAEAIAGGLALESGVYNARAAFALSAAAASGSVINLPVGYYPTRNVLDLRYGGAVCTPSKIGLASNYQYDEVGTDPNTLSNQVKILFDAEAGITFDMWVVTSALGKNLDAMQDILDETEEARDEAAAEASAAGASAGAAQASVTEAASSATAAENSATDAAASAAEAETSKDAVSALLLNGFDADKIVSGTIDPARLPNTALSALVRVQNDTERFALTVADVQEDDTVYVIDTNLLERVVDTSNLGNENGYQVFSAPVLWEGIQDKPAAFPPSAHASLHGIGGSDPITPADIGAATQTVTIADQALNTVLPATGAQSLSTVIQQMRNNLRWLIQTTATIAPPLNTADLDTYNVPGTYYVSGASPNSPFNSNQILQVLSSITDPARFVQISYARGAGITNAAYRDGTGDWYYFGGGLSSINTGSFAQISVSALNNGYTVPGNGWIVFSRIPITNTGLIISLNNQQSIMSVQNVVATGIQYGGITLRVKSGDTLKAIGGGLDSNSIVYFNAD